MPDPLKAPFVYMGGKSAVAEEVWRRFGQVKNFIEPFCGSCAVLLGRLDFDPENPPIETVNDKNAELTNCLRSIKLAFAQAAWFASDGVIECDLHSKGDALFYRRELLIEYCRECKMDRKCHFAKTCPQTVDDFRAACDTRPAFHCVIAGAWWPWGASSWIGDNWSRDAHNAHKDEDGNTDGVTAALPHLGNAGQGVNRQLPHLGDAGKGVNRQLPHLGDAGQGVNRKRPHLGNAGEGVNRKLPHLGGAGKGEFVTTRYLAMRAYFAQLRERLAKVRICTGDWIRVCGSEATTTKHGMTGIFLDPPYGVADRDSCYGEHEDFTVAARVLEWCKANGANPLLRLAVAGYEEHDELAALGWTAYRWKAQGGYGNQRTDGTVNENCRREVIWFSPHCLGGSGAMPLFTKGPRCLS